MNFPKFKREENVIFYRPVVGFELYLCQVSDVIILGLNKHTFYWMKKYILIWSAILANDLTCYVITR